MIEIILYNIVFWAAWYQISMLPERIMQMIIDNHDMTDHFFNVG